MSSILAIDAGTTGITALVVGEDAGIRGKGYREFPQHFPRPGWVEHDPFEIWAATESAISDALKSANAEPAGLSGIGITNQRETTVVWNRATLRPVANAIVWQDRRTAARCDELRAEESRIREKTGLVVDAYFSATKLEWLLRNVEGLRADAQAGQVAFGTVDAWIVAKLTGGRIHAVDFTNASRTLLYDVYERRWDEELLDLFGVPEQMLPQVLPSSGRFGEADLLGRSVPVSGIAGDQQAALFGQACFAPGMTKNTYGTGSFVLMNTGETAPPPPEGLLVTLACGEGGKQAYALEGSIFVTGAAIQWLRDGLRILERAQEAGPLAESVPDAGGVYFVPALTGLGSPYWDPYARGTIIGITRGTTRAHIVRAAVEAMAYQTRDVIEAMTARAGVELAELRVDGGASAMDFLCAFQADQLNVAVRRPKVQETTALGAAFLAGLAEGVWSSTEEIAATWKLDREFLPSSNEADRDRLYTEWKQAVERARDWARES